MLSLILSIISITLSITLFVINHYRQLYRIGIATKKIRYSEEITSTGQKKQIMFVEISIINEAQTPAIITGLTILEKELQEYSSDSGSLIDKSIPISSDDKYTATLPIVIAPYSSFKGIFAFYQCQVFSPDHFIEIETPKRFLVIPFNPVQDYHMNVEKRHGQYRNVKYHWRQNPLRTLQNKILEFFKKSWQIYIINPQNKISKIFSNLKCTDDENQG